jgi:pimeloyl-ACP methyl ester carboxylesterase
LAKKGNTFWPFFTVHDHIIVPLPFSVIKTGTTLFTRKMSPTPQQSPPAHQEAHQRPLRSRYLQWIPTDSNQVRAVEQRLLSGLSYTQRMISGINTISSPTWDTTADVGGKRHTVVLVHGFADGIGSWAKNWEFLSRSYNVHAIDLPGFGRSARDRRSFRGPDDAIRYYHDELHKWFGEVGIPPHQPITIVGHSFGGYVSSRYTMEMLWRKRKLENALDAQITDHDLLSSPPTPLGSSPSSFFGRCFLQNHNALSAVVASSTRSPSVPPPNIVHLVLADPWGVPHLQERPMNIQRKIIFHLFYRFAPLATLRYAGPWGPSLLERMRPDYADRWRHLPDPIIYYDYKYHTNAQVPATGELAFQACCEGMAFAKQPLMEYLPEMLRRIATGVDAVPHRVSPPEPTTRSDDVAGYRTSQRGSSSTTAVQHQRRIALPHLTLLHGDETWMDVGMYQKLIDEVRRDGTVGTVAMQAVLKAGHQLNADNADDFNVKLSEAIGREERL